MEEKGNHRKEQTEGRAHSHSSERQPVKRNIRKPAKRGGGLPLPMPYAGIGAGVLLVVIVILIVGLRGCKGGNSTGSPAELAKTLVTAQVEDKEKTILKCYGVQQEPSTDVRQEIDSYVSYYRAHNPSGVSVVAADAMYDEGSYAYVYVLFHLVLGDGQEYPCLRTMMVQKGEDGYRILPSSQITEELSEKAQTAYVKFMTTDMYKTYTREYDTFLRKNPGYEDRIAQSVTGVA